MGLVIGGMQDVPLTLDLLLDRAETIFSGNELCESAAGGMRRTTYGEWAGRTRRFSSLLDGLGVGPGGRVASLSFSTIRHLELYFGVPCAGRVLHTVNPRLFVDQIAYVLDHAADEVLFVDHALLQTIAPILTGRSSLRHVVVMADVGDRIDLPSTPHAWEYEELVESSEIRGPQQLDERSAAAMCYTGGTTGDPQGVVYSHRSLVLHAMSTMMAATMGIQESDTIMPVVPLFHANAVGFAHAAVGSGARLVLPGPDLSGPALARLLEAERVSVACGVPTVWSSVLPEVAGRDLGALRLIISGASAVPPALSEAFLDTIGVPLTQIWGMTETSPLGSIARVRPHLAGLAPADARQLRATAGTPVLGVQMRIVTEDGTIGPWDGLTAGELQVRGPWVAAGYHDDDRSADALTEDGWLRTGDIARLDPDGYLSITDRLKDVIKSGGEWVSSIDLENAIGDHPAVAEVAVIGIPDQRWGERPLACIVPRPGRTVTADELRDHLAGRVASWWAPEHVELLDVLPRTPVGKFAKSELRQRYAAPSAVDQA